MEILNDFWNWAAVTPEEYAKKGIVGKEEFDYPNYDTLIDYAKRLIHQSIISNSDIDTFLTIMALDNEAEYLLDYLVNNISSSRIKEIVLKGMYHMQPHTRWQIAELAYRVKMDGYLECLKYLSSDGNDYVRKRADNCLNYLGKSPRQTGDGSMS